MIERSKLAFAVLLLAAALAGCNRGEDSAQQSSQAPSSAPPPTDGGSSSAANGQGPSDASRLQATVEDTTVTAKVKPSRRAASGSRALPSPLAGPTPQASSSPYS